MLLSGVLFVLFLAGCWLYCLADAALTPAAEYRGLPKAAWIAFIAATFIIGASAWLVTRWGQGTQPRATGHAGNAGHVPLADPDDDDFNWYVQWTAADDAIARHPAGRSRNEDLDGLAVPKGPDDDPEFLRQLDHRIRGTSADPGE
jgi:hypothetical protein